MNLYASIFCCFNSDNDDDIVRWLKVVGLEFPEILCESFLCYHLLSLLGDSKVNTLVITIFKAS